MIKTETTELLANKQVWELSDKQLQTVLADVQWAAKKLGTEMAFRQMCNDADTPLAEAYGG